MSIEICQQAEERQVSFRSDGLGVKALVIHAGPTSQNVAGAKAQVGGKIKPD